MAFQDVNSKQDNVKKATDLAVGESILGYVTQIVDSKLGGKNIILKGKDGATTLFFTAGNLRYMLQDNKIAVGSYTRITRLESKQVKGKTSSQYKVEQDSTDTLGSVAEAAFMDATEPEVESKPATTARPYAGLAKSASQPKKI
jgi:hypothetical protein